MRVDPEIEEAVDKALAMIERGKRSASESIVSDLLRKHPDRHTVQYAMGVVYAMKEQYDESIEHFDKAIWEYEDLLWAVRPSTGGVSTLKQGIGA